MEKIHIVVSWEANFRAFIKYKEDAGKTSSIFDFLDRFCA